MNCPHCGAEVIPGNRFCLRCRKRIVPPDSTAPSMTPATATPYRPPISAPRSAAPASAFKRPAIVTLLAVLDLLGGAVCLLLAALSAFALVAGGSKEAGVLIAVMVGLYLLLGLVYLLAGVGLLGLKSYGRTIQLVLAFIGLLGIPVGTIISILILVYFFKPGVKILFSGRSPQELTPEEEAEVDKATASSAALIAVIVLIAILVVVAIVGIIAAIAIPSLLRARVAANESAALGDVRAVISSEVMYSSSNGGHFDTLECLAAPARCIPDYSGPTFLDSTFATPTRRGYVFTLYPGAPPDAQSFDRTRSSPSSTRDFAYVAVPVSPGRTGMRSFCGDSSGVVCQMRVGSPPRTEGGACLPPCEPVP